MTSTAISDYKYFCIDSIESAEFKFLKFPDTKIFLLGESHNKGNNRILEFYLFKKLFYSNNVRILVFESSESSVQFVKKYLKEGDETNLKISCLLTFNSYNEETRWFFRELKKFWNLLTTEDKFEIKGIDIEQEPSFIVSKLAEKINFQIEFKNDIELPILLKKILELDNDKRLPTRKRTLKIITQLKKDIMEKKEKYVCFFGNEFENFVSLLECSAVGLDIEKKLTYENLAKREDFLYENMQKLIKESSTKKIFAQLGRVHVPVDFKNEFLFLENWCSLACKLNTNNNSLAKNNIYSVLLIYDSDLEKNKYLPVIDKNEYDKIKKKCQSKYVFIKNEKTNFLEYIFVK